MCPPQSLLHAHAPCRSAETAKLIDAINARQQRSRETQLSGTPRKTVTRKYWWARSDSSRAPIIASPSTKTMRRKSKGRTCRSGEFDSLCPPPNESRWPARGASHASCTLDEVSADVALDSEFDIVVRLLDTDFDEATLQALARFGPAAISPAPQFPLSLREAVNLHRLGALTGVPLAILCPIDVSAVDLQVMRDAGLGCMLLSRGATASDVARVQQRIAELPPGPIG